MAKNVVGERKLTAFALFPLLALGCSFSSFSPTGDGCCRTSWSRLMLQYEVGLLCSKIDFPTMSKAMAGFVGQKTFNQQAVFMRIAQLAPLAESVPPKLYGGTERVVAWLVDDLVEMGHDVTLFASGDSKTKGKLYPVWPHALRLGRRATDPNAALALALESIAKMANKFDVIHSHIDWLHFPLLSRLRVPFLTTMHGRLDLSGLDRTLFEFPEANLVSISHHQRGPLPGARWIATIQHGLPPDSFFPSYERGSYLAFLGRLTAEKGPEPAIRIAQGAGMSLRIAAKIPKAERSYFRKSLEPLVDGENVQVVGEVDEAKKQPFLAGAAALLFPIDWPEPFGLVMIEAMACGTPVIAYRSGSVPEVIDEGITGFIVENEEQAVRAVGRLKELDRRSIRARFEERFLARRMAKQYESQYHKLLAQSSEHKPHSKQDA